jgi:hypothetical protein
MSAKQVVGNRWTNLYEQAAKEYVNACKNRHRANIRGWKRRIEWLDVKLKEEREEK